MRICWKFWYRLMQKRWSRVLKQSKILKNCRSKSQLFEMNPHIWKTSTDKSDRWFHVSLESQFNVVSCEKVSKTSLAFRSSSQVISTCDECIDLNSRSMLTKHTLFIISCNFKFTGQETNKLLNTIISQIASFWCKVIFSFQINGREAVIMKTSITILRIAFANINLTMSMHLSLREKSQALNIRKHLKTNDKVIAIVQAAERPSWYHRMISKRLFWNMRR